MARKTEARRKREAMKRRGQRIAGTYWLTPKAWRWPCSHCSAEHSAALRFRGHKAACPTCIERLGIKVGRGGREPAPVEVRYECPDCGGAHHREQCPRFAAGEAA